MLGPMAMGITWPPTVSYMFFYLAYWSSRDEWSKLVEYVEGLLRDIHTKRSLVRNTKVFLLNFISCCFQSDIGRSSKWKLLVGLVNTVVAYVSYFVAHKELVGEFYEDKPGTSTSHIN